MGLLNLKEGLKNWRRKAKNYPDKIHKFCKRIKNRALKT